MEKATESVWMLVRNTPGVLDRIVIHIRHEGWNITRLFVEETDDPGTSQMEITIEGTHTKLAGVMERLLGLDCVLSVSVTLDGKRVTRERRSEAKPDGGGRAEAPARVPPKPAGAYRILTINPGSTSTKFALYDDETLILTKTFRHTTEELAPYSFVIGQKGFRKQVIMDYLSAAGTDLASIDAVTGRGGLLRPIESGTYHINAAMLADLTSTAAAIHASTLGAVIASEIADELGVPSFVVDPIVVDEMDRSAKLTGIPGIERSSVFHALNQKAVARRLSKQLGKPYENCRFVVAHLGGGITVGAHRYGRVIDVNDALSGEGPFTPERAGGVPAVPLIRMCFSGEYSEREMLDRVVKSGGMKAYLGTNDSREVEKMIDNGDEFAALVEDSMAYQVSKEIGAMAAVLEGQLDAIILTGGLAHSSRITGNIKQRVDSFAPVHVFPGEDEMLALLGGTLRVLRGEERPMEYEARQSFAP